VTHDEDEETLVLTKGQESITLSDWQSGDYGIRLPYETITFKYETIIDARPAGGQANAPFILTYSYATDLRIYQSSFGSNAAQVLYGPIEGTLKIGDEETSFTSAPPASIDARDEIFLGVFLTGADVYNVRFREEGQLFGYDVKIVSVAIADMGHTMLPNVTLPVTADFAAEADFQHVEVWLVGTSLQINETPSTPAHLRTPFTLTKVGSSAAAAGEALEGDDGDNVVVAGDGNDVMYLLGGDDTGRGGLGNDTIIAGSGAGNDSYDGGAGSDDVTYRSTTLGIVVDLSLGVASGVEIDTDTLVGIENVVGGAGNDSITGNLLNNMLDGSGGHDTLSGDKGNDTLLGGEGNDSVLGGLGSDFLYGGEGSDTVLGGDLNDRMFGDAGNDSLNGQGGNDSVHGGEGNDTLLGDGFNDSLYGDRGNDSLDGGTQDDWLEGGAGNDTLLGGNGIDVLLGGEDADLIRAGSGNDSADGGEGNDSVYGDVGRDTILGGDGADALFGEDDVDSVVGGSGADTISGGRGGDVLTGGDDADVFTYQLVSNSYTKVAGGVDLITDFQDGLDLIILTGLRFTGLDMDGGNTETGELRLTFDAVTGRTHIRSDQTGFDVALLGDYVSLLADADFVF
jgi:Ca2+-binding RTX toxin-like protein